MAILGGDGPCFVVLAKPEILLPYEIEEITGCGTRRPIAEVTGPFDSATTLRVLSGILEAKLVEFGTILVD